MKNKKLFVSTAMFIIMGSIFFIGCASLHYDHSLAKNEPYAEVIIVDPRGYHPRITYIDFVDSRGITGSLNFDSFSKLFYSKTKFRVPPGNLSLSLSGYETLYKESGYNYPYYYVKSWRKTWGDYYSASIESGKRYIITPVVKGRLLTEEEWKKLIKDKVINY